VLLLYFIFKLVTQVYYIYIYMLLDKKRTNWFVAHPITKYHIHVPVVSFLTQVVLAASGSRLVQHRGLDFI
jgi:hypothetical protein